MDKFTKGLVGATVGSALASLVVYAIKTTIDGKELKADEAFNSALQGGAGGAVGYTVTYVITEKK